MKVIRIIGHPVIVISMFLLLLISGEGFGGFYLLYVILGLFYGVSHSLLAFSAIVTMLAGYKIRPGRFSILKRVLMIGGNALMILALFKFFASSKGYNDPTFHQTVPLISFALFGLCMLCNVLVSLFPFAKPTSVSEKNVNIAP